MVKSPLAIKEINTLWAGLSLQYSTVSSSHIGAHQVSRTYSSVSRKLCSPWPAPPRYPLPSLWGLHSPTFRRVCFRFHTQWAPAAFACLCLAYFTRHNVLQLHPCCLKRRDSLFLKAEWDSIVCVCVCVCVWHFLCAFIYRHTSRLWPYPATGNNTAEHRSADTSLRSWLLLRIHTCGERAPPVAKVTR